MWKKISRGMEKWGHYLLALLCAGVILLSAVWTREQQAQERADHPALSDQSQRLSQAEEEKPEAALTRPAVGAVLRPYNETPVFFPATGVWQPHPALDFCAAAGDAVCAMADGVVVSCENGVLVDHGAAGAGLYRGLQTISVQPGQHVRAGAALGQAGAWIPYEGDGHVCVSLTKDGAPIGFGEGWNGK